MPGIDASIPLGVKVPDATQQLSSLLGVAKGAQEVQNQGISLNERNAVQSVLSDPRNYTSEDGSVDFNKALPTIMRVAPTTGMQYVQKLAEAQNAHTTAQRALNAQSAENRDQMGRALASLPQGAPPDLVNKTLDALGEQFKGMGPAINIFKQTYQHAIQSGGQSAADDFIARASRQVLPQPVQQEMSTPSGVTIDNGQQSAVVNLKPGVPNVPQGQIVQGTQVQKLLPPGQQDQPMTDAFGNVLVGHRDLHGNIVGTRPMQSATPGAPGPMSFPPGESQQTFAALNEERNDAKKVALAAPTMHDINRTIVAEANKGFNTGALGALTQKVASATGYQLGPNESATDYNVLGKMLERSALTAAQSMGPHTNAGLEAAVRANGSLEYTPQALKKIAYLNDALVSGSALYSQGLEKAIGSSQNNVFAKRQFDQEWAKVADPQVLRLKNAVDNGNQEEVQNIVKEVGGKGTKGAQQLHEKLRKLLELSGQ